MYRCAICNNVSESGQSQVKLVTETRKKTYVVEGRTVGEGFETVVEIAVCEPCSIEKSLIQE
jgi:hypothetical protein